MVEIKEIKQPVGHLFKAGEHEDIYIGRVDSYAQLLDVRCQIKKEQEKGYYMMFQGQKILFDKNGTEDQYPEGYFGDIETDYLLELCRF